VLTNKRKKMKRKYKR